MWIYIIIGVVVLVAIYFLITFNNLVRLNNKVKEAFSTMDVYLKKRWDLIPNIVEVVKGYAKHEENTFKEVVELRNSVYDNLKDEEKIKTNESITNGLNKIMALSESYPQLKASENFLNLSQELKNVEEDIANSRKYYNGVVRIFNNKVEMIPSNIVAKILGYKSKSMFEAKASEREKVKVEL